MSFLSNIDHLPWDIKEQLIDIRSDSKLELEFKGKELNEVWIRRENEISNEISCTICHNLFMRNSLFYIAVFEK